MTQAFLVVVRVALAALVGYWAYRLWKGTRSVTSRGVGLLFSAILVWQIVGGRL
jgi:preprotein translocase subunit Sec63